MWFSDYSYFWTLNSCHREGRNWAMIVYIIKHLHKAGSLSVPQTKIEPMLPIQLLLSFTGILLPNFSSLLVNYEIVIEIHFPRISEFSFTYWTQSLTIATLNSHFSFHQKYEQIQFQNLDVQETSWIWLVLSEA